ALGAIAYEMLTGEPPHTGSSSQAVIARLLTDPVRPVRDSRPSVPEHVDAAVACALEKLPADRFSSAKQFADALPAPGLHMSGPRAAARHPRHASRRETIAAVVAGIAVIAAVAGWWRVAHITPPLPIRFTVEPPQGSVFATNDGLRIALSPDGRTLAYAT